MYTFIILLYYLLKNFLFYDSLQFIFLYFYYYFDLLLLYIEQPFYNHVKIIEPIFIFGFPRSATTTFHESLYRSTNICSLTCYDTTVKSNIMKFLLNFFHLNFIIDYLLNKNNTNGHGISPTALGEEHYTLFRIIIRNIHSLLIVVPQDVLSEVMEIKKHHLQIIKMVITRKIKKNEIFVGKSLFLAPYLNDYLEVFPDMRKIHCKRNFDDCFKSFITLVYNISKIKNNYIDEHNFNIFIKNIYHLNMKKTRLCIDSIDFEYTINFQDWCDDLKKQLKDVIDHFKIPKKDKLIEYKESKNIPLPDNLMSIYNSYIMH